MNRRDAIKRTALLMGGALSATTLSMVLNGCGNNSEKEKTNSNDLPFSEDEKAMIKRIADVIIPKTDTPGAVEAGVGAFIPMMMLDCYPKKDQKSFHDGLANFNKWCKDKYGNAFLKLSEEQQAVAVEALDKAVLGKEKNEDLSFYKTFKELTLLGFFTSEPGATKTLRYVVVPGMYDGCVPYEEGQRAWAT